MTDIKEAAEALKKMALDRLRGVPLEWLPRQAYCRATIQEYGVDTGIYIRVDGSERQRFDDWTYRDYEELPLDTDWLRMAAIDIIRNAHNSQVACSTMDCIPFYGKAEHYAGDDYTMAYLALYMDGSIGKYSPPGLTRPTLYYLNSEFVEYIPHICLYGIVDTVPTESLCEYAQKILDGVYFFGTCDVLGKWQCQTIYERRVLFGMDNQKCTEKIEGFLSQYKATLREYNTLDAFLSYYNGQNKKNLT